MNAEDWYGFDNNSHVWYYLGKYTCYDDIEYDHVTEQYSIIESRNELNNMIVQLKYILSSTERVP